MLALRGNQSLVHNEIKTCLDACIADPKRVAEQASTHEKNRDRLEARTCWKASDLSRFESMHWMLDILFQKDQSRLQNANAHRTWF